MTSPTYPANSRTRPDAEKKLDKAFIWLTFAFAIGIGAILVAIALVIAIEALPAIREFGFGFLTTSAWNPVEGREQFGALPVIYGTLVSSLIALLLAVPLGVGTAIFLSEDFIPLNIRTILVFLVELLAAIPSVVYGLWGIFVLIPIITPIGSWLHLNFGLIPLFGTEPTGPGMLPAGVILAIMILPIITAISRDSLASLPPELRSLFGLRGNSLGNNLPSVNPGGFLWDRGGNYARARSGDGRNHGSDNDYRQF